MPLPRSVLVSTPRFGLNKKKKKKKKNDGRRLDITVADESSSGNDNLSVNSFFFFLVCEQGEEYKSTTALAYDYVRELSTIYN